MSRSVPYLTWTQLATIAVRAYENGRPNYGDRLLVYSLPRENIYPIGDAVAVDEWIRCSVVYTAVGEHFVLDLTPREYSSLLVKSINS